ncbi:hypothetical protein M011DRAFT_475572 [Sporormia fimetaria CBS 119925]|uniref:Uncharacterized protein n=1 Tax=Sporormia fimetaria CBS 119925 TaxID=1340428 RepID=A0A6A6VIE7_9PLEO|nr:hypothetical protein M011DRAFT_475572 [Sporormia fimetaria CBS 119925]
MAASRAPRNAGRRSYATEPTPSPQPRQPQSQAGAFYKSFGMPVAKCFLGALFTYQVVYWGWMKLESLEEKKDTEDEILRLKEELKLLVQQRILEEEKAAAEAEKPATVAATKSGKKGWW